MNDDIENDLHDTLVKCMIEYINENNRFNIYGYVQSAVRIRSTLSKIHVLAKKRRVEINNQRKAKHGDPHLGLPPTAPSEMRTRKMQRQIQKQQAKSGNLDT